MKPFYVYMLRCADSSYYVGHTDNLEARIGQHEAGALGGYTARRRPVELVFVSEHSSRDEAFARERKIKGWSRSKKAALARGDWNAIRQLARGTLWRKPTD